MAELIFSRDAGQDVPQSSGLKSVQPIGSAESQVDEAMRLSKERNRKAAEHEEKFGLLERVAKMDSMNVPTAIEFLDALPQAERENYLRAEVVSKKRRGVLGAYGWEI